VLHQALQHLQRNPRIEPMYGVAVAEGVRSHRHGECGPFTGSRLNRIVQPGTHRPVGYRPEPDLLYTSAIRITSLKRNFSVATIISNWATYCGSDSGTSR